MGFLHETTAIVGSQLRYRRESLSFALFVLVAALVGMQIADAPAEKYRDISAALSVLLGGLVAVFSWGGDTFERRVRLLAMLPASRVSIAVARLVAVASLQFAVTLATWLVSLPLTLGTGTVQEFSLVLGAAAIWMTALLFTSHLFEEVNIALAGKRWALWLINIVAAGALMWVLVVPMSDFLDVVLEPFAVAVGAALALAVGSASVLLFCRRSTFDVGVSPWHGFPVDWSEESE